VNLISGWIDNQASYLGNARVVRWNWRSKCNQLPRFCLMHLRTEAVIFTDCADLNEFICHINEVLELGRNAMKITRLIWQTWEKKIVNGVCLGRITDIEENLMEIQAWQLEQFPLGSNIVQSGKCKELSFLTHCQHQMKYSIPGIKAQFHKLPTRGQIDKLEWTLVFKLVIIAIGKLSVASTSLCRLEYNSCF